MKRYPLTFFLLVFLFSIPIWAVEPIAERILPKELTLDLPFSSLMSFTPVIAAAVLVRRESGSDAVKALLRKAFDHKRIQRKAWYAPILLLMPAVMVLQFGLMRLLREPPPAPRIPVLLAPAAFALFFIAALGEEVGWQGYALDPLQKRWNALTAGIVLGLVTAAWHIVPLIQLNRTPAWIAWQCMNIAVVRILTVWLYNNTEKSLFAAIAFHAMYNVSTVLLPAYGWPYDPLVAFIILAVAAATIIFLQGPQTLARYRYARPGRDVQAGVAS